MFEAQLRGKFPRQLWDKSEDLLTSAVFGTLKNLPLRITSTLFQRAKPLSGDVAISFEPEHWEFWPWWQDDSDAANGCEPDVVLSSSSGLCVVEAKLRAGFGSEPGKRDQLDREWRCGKARAINREFILLTVTNHLDVPRQEIESQLFGATYDPTHILWLSWAEIARHLESVELSQSDRRWCVDLLRLIEAQGIGPFLGFGDLISEGRRVLQSRHPLILDTMEVGYADLILGSHSVAGSLYRLDWMKETFTNASAT